MNHQSSSYVLHNTDEADEDDRFDRSDRFDWFGRFDKLGLIEKGGTRQHTDQSTQVKSIKCSCNGSIYRTIQSWFFWENGNLFYFSSD